MKLIDFLKTVDKDEYVYLGAESCYLWIGLPEEIIAKLPSLDEEYIRRIKIEIKNNDLRMQELRDLLSVEEDTTELKKLKRLQKREITLADQLANRIPFGERDVRDVYRKHIMKPVGIAVLIKGGECGDYWSLDEIRTE